MLQKRRLFVDVLHADGFALRIERVQRADDAERAQGHDEGRHLQPRDQRAVEEAERGAAKETERKGKDRRHAVEHGESSHHHRGDDHDDADRQIDACGQNHQGLANAENARDHHLGQDSRHVAGRGEAHWIDRHAEQQAQRQHDEGDSRRIECRKRWRRWRKVRRSSSKEATVAVAAVSTFSNSCGAGRPAGDASLMASSLVSRLFLASLWTGARAFPFASAEPIVFSRLSSELSGEINPSRASSPLRR